MTLGLWGGGGVAPGASMTTPRSSSQGLLPPILRRRLGNVAVLATVFFAACQRDFRTSAASAMTSTT